jgi:hypothetical protein
MEGRKRYHAQMAGSSRDDFRDCHPDLRIPARKVCAGNVATIFAS